MKKVNNLLNRITKTQTLELETFDLINVFSEDYEENVKDYQHHAAALEIDVSKGLIPFPTMSKAEENTWKVYCPQIRDISAFPDIMPLEIIRLARICQNKGWFHEILVWSEQKEAINPILVGVLNKEYDSPLYLLGRWGQALKPYEEVRKSAMETWRNERKITISKRIKDFQRSLEDLSEDEQRYFSGEWVGGIY